MITDIRSPNVLEAIALYACAPPETTASDAALDAAHLIFVDALACALLALAQGDARRVITPPFSARVPNGARVPGTALVLDPLQAAFAFGALVRWLDYNDTWLAREWGHPSDNLGALLPLADYLTRTGQRRLLVGDVLAAMIRTHEIQGVLAEGNALNRAGLDHVLLVKVATAAIGTRLLGGALAHVRAAVSNAFADGAPLRVYRHAPDAGARKSWAAGDAASRGLWLAYLAMGGEPAYPHVLTTPTWGLADALLRGEPLVLPRPLGNYVIQHALLKPAFPAEYHGQSAVEAALALHPLVRARVAQVARIEVTTHEAARRIIDKTGPLSNPADRDHCLQYMIAVALLDGELTYAAYEAERAADERIDALRSRMVVREDAAYSASYLDPAERDVANALQVFFADGTMTERVEIRKPLGHPARRREALPYVARKLEQGLRATFPEPRVARLTAQLESRAGLAALPVDALLDLLTP